MLNKGFENIQGVPKETVHWTQERIFIHLKYLNVVENVFPKDFKYFI